MKGCDMSVVLDSRNVGKMNKHTRYSLHAVANEHVDHFLSGCTLSHQL